MHLSRIRKTLVGAITALGVVASVGAAPVAGISAAAGPRTATPIQHVIVIFQENVSFDHYFATYPMATNPTGEPQFVAAPNTPSVNGLNEALLSYNPNTANPTRLDRSQAMTCDQGHGYTQEQLAYDAGLADKFVQNTGDGGPGCNPTQVMDYYDGNTVTAMWNYAQSFAMSDNSYNTQFGPSTPGAVNLISGLTYGATPTNITGKVAANGTVVGDADSTYDDCSGSTKIAMSSKNVGDLLNAKDITWGWFEGGFAPTATNNGIAVCGTSSVNVGGATVTDYIPHHEPFQYYQSTGQSAPPAADLGRDDR